MLVDHVTNNKHDENTDGVGDRLHEIVENILPNLSSSPLLVTKPRL